MGDLRTQKIFGVGDYWVKKTFLFMESLFLCAKIALWKKKKQKRLLV